MYHFFLMSFWVMYMNEWSNIHNDSNFTVIWSFKVVIPIRFYLIVYLPPQKKISKAMQNKAIKTVAKSLPPNKVILLNCLISNSYIPYIDLRKISGIIFKVREWCYSGVSIWQYVNKGSLRGCNWCFAHFLVVNCNILPFQSIMSLNMPIFITM